MPGGTSRFPLIAADAESVGGVTNTRLTRRGEKRQEALELDRPRRRQVIVRANRLRERSTLLRDHPVVERGAARERRQRRADRRRHRG